MIVYKLTSLCSLNVVEINNKMIFGSARQKKQVGSILTLKEKIEWVQEPINALNSSDVSLNVCVKWPNLAYPYMRDEVQTAILRRAPKWVCQNNTN